MSVPTAGPAALWLPLAVRRTLTAICGFSLAEEEAAWLRTLRKPARCAALRVRPRPRWAALRGGVPAAGGHAVGPGAVSPSIRPPPRHSRSFRVSRHVCCERRRGNDYFGKKPPHLLMSAPLLCRPASLCPRTERRAAARTPRRAKPRADPRLSAGWGRGRPE